MSRRAVIWAIAVGVVLGACFLPDSGWGVDVINRCDHTVDVWYVDPGSHPETVDDAGVRNDFRLDPGRRVGVSYLLDTPGSDIIVPGTSFRVEFRPPAGVDPRDVPDRSLTFDLDGAACET